MASSTLSVASMPATPRAPLRDLADGGEPKATELVREAAGLAEELFRIELALAKDDLVGDVRALKVSAIAWAVALPAMMVGLALLLVAAVWVGGPIVALAVGAGLVVVSLVAAILAYRHVPKHPMEATLRRLRVNRALLKGHMS